MTLMKGRDRGSSPGKRFEMDSREEVGPKGCILEEEVWLQENSPGIEWFFFNETEYYAVGGRDLRKFPWETIGFCTGRIGSGEF